MDFIPSASVGSCIFLVGQFCIFHNRHKGGHEQFDNMACMIIDILPRTDWLEEDIPEYRVQFHGYCGRLNNVKVEENELEPLPD